MHSAADQICICADGTSTGYTQAEYGTGTADPAGYGQQAGYDQQESYGPNAYAQQGYGYSADGSYGASDAASAGHAGHGTSQSEYSAVYPQASNWLRTSQTFERKVTSWSSWASFPSLLADSLAFDPEMKYS